MRGRKTRLLWTVSILLFSGSALAQGAPPPDGNKELAKEWANKAKERFDAGDWQGAIDRIREAEKHAHPPTFTRLEAQANEKLGKLLEAQRLYRSIVDLQLPADAPDAWVNAQAGAKKDLAALTPRIPTLEIHVTEAPPAIEIVIDGTALDPAQHGRPVPLDPGVHTVVVRGRDRSATREVTLREGVPEKVEIFLPAPIPRPRDPVLAPTAVPERAPAPVLPPFLKFVAFGVGGAGLVAGGITGGIVLGETGKAREASCVPGTDTCLESARPGLERLQLLADISTASFIVAGVGIAAGTVLLLLPGKRQAPSVGVAVSPSSLSLWGAF